MSEVQATFETLDIITFVVSGGASSTMAASKADSIAEAEPKLLYNLASLMAK